MILTPGPIQNHRSTDTAELIPAIGYCQQYAKSHGPDADPDSKWKFNKAKQIWLVRHLWDDTEVPDEYVDVIVAYLKTVQGGGRAVRIMLFRHAQRAKR